MMRDFIFILEKVVHDEISKDELDIYIKGFGALLRKIQAAPQHIRANLNGALGIFYWIYILIYFFQFIT